MCASPASELRPGVGARVLLGAAVAATGVVALTGRLPWPPCPFHAATGWWCPACGGTRAVDALLRADPGAAIGFNALVVIALPVLAYALAAVNVPALPRPRRIPGTAWVVLAVVVGSFWLARNLPFAAALAP
jgi:hypothetical protein